MVFLKKTLLFSILLCCYIGLSANSVYAAPSIVNINVETPGDIEKYAKFEASFDINDGSYTNPYFPYDLAYPNGNISPEAIAAGNMDETTGITIDMLLLSPGETDWNNAKTLPCFYYQPVEAVGTGSRSALLPYGSADWRCRFTPEKVGQWQYKIKAQDAGGTTESGEYSFQCVDSDRKGFINISSTDSRFFEFSDGSPFTTPLVDIDGGSQAPLNDTLEDTIAYLTSLKTNGVRFLRWFPTDEGANNKIRFFGGDLIRSWVRPSSGEGKTHYFPPETDVAVGNKVSLQPWWFTGQQVSPKNSAQYRLSFRALLEGEQVLRVELHESAVVSEVLVDICSASNVGHDAGCDYKQDGWQDYTFFTETKSDAEDMRRNFEVHLRGLYTADGNGPEAPYNEFRDGRIRMHSIKLQRDETGNGDWGPNLLTRSNPETYNYVDQIGAAYLDKVLELSEPQGNELGVYHKLVMFEKNDFIVNRLTEDGSLYYCCDGGGDYYSSWDVSSKNFYSKDERNYTYDGSGEEFINVTGGTGEFKYWWPARWYERAFTRYFIGRWSYSPAIHSLEFANESFFNDWSGVSYARSFDATFSWAEYIRGISPRYLLLSNSFPKAELAAAQDLLSKDNIRFWNYIDYYPNRNLPQLLPDYSAELIDYYDLHWYAREGGGSQKSLHFDDSVAYVRECTQRFEDYYNPASPYYPGELRLRPITRGEGGVQKVDYGMNPHPDLKKDIDGIWFRKKIWAHVGTLGNSCDGDWYTRYLDAYDEDGYSRDYNIHDIFRPYDSFMAGEDLDSGNWQEIGVDLNGNQKVDISTASGSLRAYGSQDTFTKKTLLWIDNATHTWWNVINGLFDPVDDQAGGTITVHNLATNDTYTIEVWDPWDTAATEPVRTLTKTSNGAGDLGFTINEINNDQLLEKDIAVKLIPQSQPPNYYLADLDNSGYIDLGDFVEYLSLWGSQTSTGDMNSDNKINGTDISWVISYWGQECQ